MKNTIPNYNTTFYIEDFIPIRNGIKATPYLVIDWYHKEVRLEHHFNDDPISNCTKIQVNTTQTPKLSDLRNLVESILPDLITISSGITIYLDHDSMLHTDESLERLDTLLNTITTNGRLIG